MKKITTLLLTAFLAVMTSITYADTAQDTTDAAITAKVNTLLLKNQFVTSANPNKWNIFVSTKNQVVTLTGEVKNYKDKGKIAHTVEGVSGVKSVQNELTVNPGVQTHESTANKEADIAQSPEAMD
jgi:osmotically-inducible protein OsmY